MTPLERRHDERTYSHRLNAEVGLALSLFLLAGLFQLSWTPAPQAEEVFTENEVVRLEEVQVTQQLPTAPPPPALPPPVEVPDEQAVEEVLLPSIELNLDAPVEAPAAPPPPPPPAPREAPPPEPEPPPPPEPEVFVVVEQMPELIGGLAAIQPEYPEMDRMAGVEGRVYVEFVVLEDGTVTDVRVVRGVSAGLDDAALEAVRKARFTPGLQRGRPVRVKMAIPITFRIRT